MLDELARDSPVLCAIDDAQWLNEASASAPAVDSAGDPGGALRRTWGAYPRGRRAAVAEYAHGDFHLRNVFAKVGISSRTELARLPLD
jgi:hypothetical protein